MPSGLLFGNANSAKPVRHPCRTGGQTAKQVCVEQKRLKNQRFLRFQQTSQFPKTGQQGTATTNIEKMDGNPFTFQDWNAGGSAGQLWECKSLILRAGFQRINNRCKFVPVQPERDFAKSQLRPAAIQFGNAKSDGNGHGRRRLLYFRTTSEGRLVRIVR